jgi:hypothetical protein
MNAQTQGTPKCETRGQAPVPAKAGVSQLFDLGDAGGSNIAKEKDTMIGEAFDSFNKKGARTT